ncbi:MAG TPA: GAF domain-containing protein, partial [Longimicrobiales bacterium]|nr:GAF domain-containing protein [Longimicrobiales bacterium]
MAPTSSHSPKQEHQQLDQLAILYAMADHIQRARQIDQIYEEAAQGLRRAVAADRSALLIADDRGVLRCKARHGIPDHCLETLEDHSPWPRGTRDPRPLVVEDLTDDHQIGEAAPAFLSEGVRALAFIPLLHRGRLLGNFMIGHDAPRQFTSAELRLAEAIAGHLAFAIWRSRSDADQAELLRRFEAERSVLEAVVKQMPAGVLLADVPSGRIVMTNQRMIEIWQRPYRPAGSVDDYVTWSGVDQAGVRLSPTDWPLARTVLHGETVRGEEVTIVRGDGTERVIRVSSTPVEDSQGRTLAAVAIVDDVTEQKTEEANRRFLEEGTRILNASLELDSTLTALAELVTERHADACAVYRVTDAGTIQQVANARAAGREEVLSTVLPDATVNLEDDNLLAWVTRERKALLVPTLEDGTLDLLHPTEPHQEGLTERLDGGSLMILPLVARDRAVGAMALVRSLRYDENELLLMTELGRRASLATENALL